MITGFNVPEGAVQFIGIQWSTFTTFCFFFYLLMMNFQTGGLRSAKQLWGCFKMDLYFLAHPWLRKQYPEDHQVSGFLAIFASAMACVCSLFAFETIWVPLYNYSQFGRVLWPVYFALTKFPLPIIRNSLLFVLPIAMILLLFSLSKDYGMEMRLRINNGWLGLLEIAFLSWIAWITFPHQIFPISSLSASNVIGPTASSFSHANCYVFPSQNFFPQNTYTFYPCSLFGMSYTPPQILGFFSPDNAVHAMNVLTKFATFAAVCFPFMAIARRSR